MKASVYIRDHIESLVRLIRAELQAVGAQTHDEVLHDLRGVCAPIAGGAAHGAPTLLQKKTRAIEGQLRMVTNETNALRDAEVTLPVLRLITLDTKNQPEVDSWIGRLQSIADAKRTDLTALLAGERLAEPLEAVIALMATPPVAKGQRSVGKHARAHTEYEFKRVRKMLKDAPQRVDDPARMHALRIAAKRLRYTAEFYAPVLRRNAAKWARAAHLIQQELGTLHDLDVLMEMIRTDETLPLDTREALLAALNERRATQAQRSLKTMKAARRKFKN